MIARIIEWSARNPFLIVVMMALILAGGGWAIVNTPLDAIPDLSDVQVIVYTPWEDRSPDIIEDQVTYPIVTQLLSAPRVKAVRASSFYGFSLVYVIFDDSADLYWARSRVLEYLSGMTGKLPDGVAPELGPDATGVGWALEYVLIDRTGRHSLADLRTLQDWHVQYQLRAVPGVAEVAAVGAFVKQYQVTVDPDKLLAYQVPINRVVERVRKSNQEVGGRVIEFTGHEYMVRGRGYFQKVSDIEEVSLGSQKDGTPIRVRDVGDVELGPEIRRGVVDYNGLGDAAGGVVVVRFGASVHDVLQRVKRTIDETVRPSLPRGVELIVTYDRSTLIEQSVANLRQKLIEESLIVSAVCLVFLFHLRSALVAVLTLPLAVLLALLAMCAIGLTSNIMSLGGIAIAVGAMIDAAIVMIENAHKHIEHEEARPETERRPRQEVLIDAAREVGPSLFFSLLIITVGFFPVFALQDQEGRLFKPLAFTKTFAMLFAALLSITVAPFLMTLLIRGSIPPESKNPVNRLLIVLYRPFAWLAAPVSLRDDPARDRGSRDDRSAVPQPGKRVHAPTLGRDAHVHAGDLAGSVDRDDARGDPGPGPAPDECARGIRRLRQGRAGRDRDRPRASGDDRDRHQPQAPSAVAPGMTPDLLTAELDTLLKQKLVGFSTSWTMPIKGRIDMLSTGIRTPIGVKVFGADLAEISRLGREIERAVNMVPGTRSAFAERVSEGYYLDFAIKRPAIGRYGLTVDDVQQVIQSAVGGANVTTTIEGRERFPVNVRYGRELRDDLGKLRRVLVDTPGGAQIPLEELAELRINAGPTMIKSEAAQLVGYVYIDIKDRDAGGYVRDARAMVDRMVKLPPGYSLQWSGSFESMERATRRLTIVIPLTLLIIVILLYISTKSMAKVAIVLLAVPFSLVGAFLLLWLLGYHLSVAVWVGIIALAGVDAETGVVMLLYLDVAYENARTAGRMASMTDLEHAVIEGAVQRVRPKMMTVLAILMGLLPIMWSTGAGSDVMKRIAAPMVGGILTSFLLELLIYPAIFTIWKSWTEFRTP